MKQQEAFDLLNVQLKDISKVQIRSMSLAVLPRLMNVLDKNQETCTHCQKFSHEGEAFVRNIRPLFEQDLLTGKRFEQWIDESQKHLRTTHAQTVKGKTTSLFATIGMSAGILSGLIFTLLMPETSALANISLGWTIGMLTGYTAGKLKEKSLARDNKLY